MAIEMSEDLKKLLAEIEECPQCKEAKKGSGTFVIVGGQPATLYICKKHGEIVVSCWLEWIRIGKP